MENEKWTGHVERDGHFAAFYLTPPPAAVARFQTAQRTLSQPIKIARADYLDPIYDYKGNIKISLDGKPELLPLVEQAKAILSQVKAEDAAKWAAQRAAQELIDQPEIEAAGLRLAEWLIETPETHVILDCDYEAGAADGWGAPTYKYQGIEIRPHVAGIPSLRTHLASAGRPGALGSFWHCLNATAERNEVEAAVAAVQKPKPEAAAHIPAPGVGYCYSCETYCHGDCGDYAPTPEPRHLERQLREAAAEADYGIKD